MQHNRADYQFRIQDNSGHIPEDEPVFLLRGQDQAAAAAVRCWAAIAEAMDADPRTIDTALIQADLMEAWPVKKIPDNPFAD